MARATTAGRAVHGGKLVPATCIALSGKGVPGSGGLEQAIEAVTRTARALHDATRRRGHEWKPGDPEVALRRPAGVRGGVGWTVRLAVPSFVTAREVHEAAAEAARHAEIAKNIRLARVEATPEQAAGNGRAGRDHQPAGIRRVRAGAPQHRARDLR
ncbi:MAG TPA: hypothetical protein VFK90_11840 [Anaeromyxobacter sp.]|nr:hypothetical protein [Anaeromyxobacter sp.]